LLLPYLSARERDLRVALYIPQGAVGDLVYAPRVFESVLPFSDASPGRSLQMCETLYLYLLA
jgi:hypothetical protein